MLDSDTGWCPSPLIPLGIATDPDQVLDTRVCSDGCCAPCMIRINVTGPSRHLTLSLVICGFISFGFANFILLSQLVNRRLVMNGYSSLQSICTIIFVIAVSFLSIDPAKTFCSDSITYASGKTNPYCLTQGLLYTFGLHGIVLSMMARVMSIHFKVVWSRHLSRYVLTAIVVGIAAIFTGVSVSNIWFTGAFVCRPNASATLYILFIPTVVFSSITFLLQSWTSLYISATLYNVAFMMRQAQQPNSKVRIKDRFLFGVHAVVRSCQLSWRTIVFTLFVACALIFTAADYYVSRTPWFRSHKSAPGDYVDCLVFQAQLRNETSGTSSFVSDDLGWSINESAALALNNDANDALSWIYRHDTDNLSISQLDDATLSNQTAYMTENCNRLMDSLPSTLLSLCCLNILTLSGLILLMTELRPYLFQGWFQLIKRPSSIFCRRKSDAVLDRLSEEKRVSCTVRESYGRTLYPNDSQQTSRYQPNEGWHLYRNHNHQHGGNTTSRDIKAIFSIGPRQAPCPPTCNSHRHSLGNRFWTYILPTNTASTSTTRTPNPAGRNTRDYDAGPLKSENRQFPASDTSHGDSTLIEEREETNNNNNNNINYIPTTATPPLVYDRRERFTDEISPWDSQRMRFAAGEDPEALAPEDSLPRVYSAPQEGEDEADIDGATLKRAGLSLIDALNMIGPDGVAERDQNSMTSRSLGGNRASTSTSNTASSRWQSVKRTFTDSLWVSKKS